MSVVLVSNIVEANGKTVRENNLERKHELQLGHLVEFAGKTYHSAYEGNDSDIEVQVTGSLYVVGLGRDCDGSPLYHLSNIPVEFPIDEPAFSKERMLYKYLSNHIVLNIGYYPGSSDGMIRRIVSGPHKLSLSLREWAGL